MRSKFIVAAALVVLELSALHAAEPSKDPAKNSDITKFSTDAMNAQSLAVGLLREGACRSNPLADQDANNAAFAGCVMYVLGAVDMIREWQKIDPTHAGARSAVASSWRLGPTPRPAQAVAVSPCTAWPR